MTRRLTNEKHPVDPTSGEAAGVVTHKRGAGAHHSNRLSEPLPCVTGTGRDGTHFCQLSPTGDFDELTSP